MGNNKYIISDRVYNAMSDKLDFSKLELLTEEELNEAKGKWTLDDWIAYYTKNGVMTHEEMRQYTLNLAYKMLEMKYGSDHHERK